MVDMNSEMLFVIYSTLLAISTFVAGHFWRLRSMYVHEFRSHDLNFFSHSLQAQKDSIHRKIAEEYLKVSEDYRKTARCRNYSAACAFWSVLLYLIGWILAITLGGYVNVLLYLYLIVPTLFLFASFWIYSQSIGYTKAQVCLEKLSRIFPFLWPTLLPRWEEIEDVVKSFQYVDESAQNLSANERAK